MPEFQNVVVVGLGYIGLPTAAVIASRGMRVVGVDVNERVVKTVASGAIHIAEPDLEGLVQKVVSSGSLKVATEPEAADVFIIAVPTPIDEEKRADLGSVMKSVDSIAGVLRAGNLVILESTVPIGTTEEIAKKIAHVRPDLRVGMADGSEHGISVAYCPERVLPGRILSELVNNDRCIGGVTPHCARRAQRFYKTFVRGACIATTARAAEMVKLTENAFRDTNIAFANELSLICHRYGVKVWEVIDCANRHPRVNVLRPGPGVGGHCIAVDPWFIVEAAPDLARLISTARSVNDAMPEHVVELARQALGELTGAAITTLGLTYKANVGDLRESPAVTVVQHLRRAGAVVRTHDPL